MSEFDLLRRDGASRRLFLKRMTAAGLGAAAMAMFSPAFQSGILAQEAEPAASRASKVFGSIPGRNINEQALNFALTLEILEADLYRQALNQASGLPLGTPLSNNASTYHQTLANGALPADRAAISYLYLVQFAYVEAAHRDFLAAAIAAGGGTPVSPNPNGYAFPGGPGQDIRTLIDSDILPLEETGVRAYLGALPHLTDLNLAQVAGTIYSTEARHSAVLKYTTFMVPDPNFIKGDQRVISRYPHFNTLEYFLTPTTVLKKAAAYFL